MRGPQPRGGGGVHHPASYDRCVTLALSNGVITVVLLFQNADNRNCHEIIIRMLVGLSPLGPAMDDLSARRSLCLQ
jgi:hypothetical protein